MKPVQTLRGIPGAQLRVEWVGSIADLHHPCIAQWLKQHAELISHLTVEVDVSEDMLKLRDFSEAAAFCRSIDLAIKHSPRQVVDLADLQPVAGSLQHFTSQPKWLPWGRVTSTSTFDNMSHLTALHLINEDLSNEEPWGFLTSLKGLQQLKLEVRATGDPSPLSALTGLSALYLQSFLLTAVDATPFSFSSLQPLSTLQQLEVLHLGDYACAATSLQGLAGLSNLKQLVVHSFDCVVLASLEGISPCVVELSIKGAEDLVSLAGIEGCTSMEKLSLKLCGVSSLQPLRGLSSMKALMVDACSLNSLEGLDSMSLQSLTLESCQSLTHLSGVGHASALKSLVLEECGVTSLQPLSQLGTGLQRLWVSWCDGVQEDVLELPHFQPTADVDVRHSNVKEVVLAGGVRLACMH
jgi:hypothetical protein